MIWDSFTWVFAKVLSLLWFTGAVLMAITIPACIYKIFSALWEDDNPETEQGIVERYRKV